MEYCRGRYGQPPLVSYGSNSKWRQGFKAPWHINMRIVVFIAQVCMACNLEPSNPLSLLQDARPNIQWTRRKLYDWIQSGDGAKFLAEVRHAIAATLGERPVQPAGGGGMHPQLGAGGGQVQILPQAARVGQAFLPAGGMQPQLGAGGGQVQLSPQAARVGQAF